MVFAGDSGLLNRFRAGEQGALETVYRAYVDCVARTANAVLRACLTGTEHGRAELASELPDVVQQVFVQAFSAEARRRFDGSRPYGPYLAQITRNVAVDHWRRMRRYVPVEIDRLVQETSAERGRPDDEGAAWSDPSTIRVVEQYIASLDPESRRVHEAIYVKGLSQRETADALGLGRQAIRTREAKLREGLRRALAQQKEPAPRAKNLIFS